MVLSPSSQVCLRRVPGCLASHSAVLPESLRSYPRSFCTQSLLSGDVIDSYRQCCRLPPAATSPLPYRALPGGEEAQLHLELNVGQPGSEIKCVFRVRKGIVGY